MDELAAGFVPVLKLLLQFAFKRWNRDCNFMPQRDTADAWHFVWDERGAFWTWKRLTATGEAIAESLYTFASLNACVADAERAGFINKGANLRRMRVSELAPTSAAASTPERRRRPRGI